MLTFSAFTAIGHLGLRDVHGRTRIAVQAAVARVADDADDLPLGLARELLHHAAPDHELLADRIPVRPELLRHRLVDDDHPRRGGGVAFVEARGRASPES